MGTQRFNGAPNVPLLVVAELESTPSCLAPLLLPQRHHARREEKILGASLGRGRARARGRRWRPATAFHPASSCLEAGAGEDDLPAEGPSHWQPPSKARNPSLANRPAKGAGALSPPFLPLITKQLSEESGTWAWSAVSASMAWSLWKALWLPSLRGLPFSGIPRRICPLSAQLPGD